MSTGTRLSIGNRTYISLVLGFCLFFSSIQAFAVTPAPADRQDQAIAITGVTLHVGNGDVIENAQVTFANGEITSVSSGSSDSERQQDLARAHKILDYKGKHMYPGFVLPMTYLGLVEVGAVRASRDLIETGVLNPNVHVKYAYNTDSELIPTFRFNGVLTAQVIPAGPLLAGVSSVMQLDAWNFEDAIVHADDGMHLYWPSHFVSKYDYGRGIESFSENKAYSNLVASLDDLFAQASVFSVNNSDNNVNQKLASVKLLLDGKMKFYIHATQSDEILAALDFVKAHKIPDVVLVTRQGVLPVAAQVLAMKVPVIIDGVHLLPEAEDDDVSLLYQLPHRLKSLGLEVGLAATTGMSPGADRNLPFMAGQAAAGGMDPEAAVKMISLDNAKILGIDKTLGSVEVGKRATFFISDGDALDMRGNQLLKAYIDGRDLELDGMQQTLYKKYLNRSK